MKRKVVASTTGAGAAGFIPLLLELVDALKLSPQVAATVTTVVAALGALVAGYLTPDRPPVLPGAAESVTPHLWTWSPSRRCRRRRPRRGARRAGGPPRSTGRQVTPDGRRATAPRPHAQARPSSFRPFCSFLAAAAMRCDAPDWLAEWSGGARDRRFSIGGRAA